MVDIHSHILPGMDDGSKTPEETTQLLRQLADQGVDSVIATPHFYSNREDIQQFLRRREAAVERLKKESTIPEGMSVYLGAEVALCFGIGHSKRAADLCITGTKYILIEMPFDNSWSDRVVQELYALKNEQGLVPILAHIERYDGRKNNRTLQQLYWDGFLMQSNADYFLKKHKDKVALRYLDDGLIHLLGSDCHNLDERPPRIGEAVQKIAQTIGEDAVDDLDYMGKQVVSSATPI